jgi:hypothetical protein
MTILRVRRIFRRFHGDVNAPPPRAAVSALSLLPA